MKKGQSTNSGARWVQLPHWMLRSKAWRALSPNAKAVLIHVWERHNGANNGQIVYSVRDAEEIGISKTAAARALNESIELGFLRVTRSSSFTLKTKEAREWSLTAERIGIRPATKDFMRWSPPKFKPRSPQRDIQSPQRDRNTQYAQKGGTTVPPAGPSEAESTPSRSPQRDTSMLPSHYDGDRERWFRQTMVPYLRSELPYGQARAIIRGWEAGDPASMDLVDGFELELREREERVGPRYPRFGDAAKAERTARRWLQ